MAKIWTTIVTSLGAAIIAVFGTIVVGGFDYFNKDKELDIRLVNVGLSILRGEATGDTETLPARRFALRLLRKYADVEIPEVEFSEWAERGTVPFKNIGWDGFSANSRNITESIQELPGLLTGYGFMLGTLMVALGCAEAPDHVENPGRNNTMKFHSEEELRNLPNEIQNLCRQLKSSYKIIQDTRKTVTDGAFLGLGGNNAFDDVR